MGKTILVVGVDESDITSIVEMVIKTNKKYFPKLAFAKLPDFSKIETMENFNSSKQEFNSKFQNFLSDDKNTIITGTLVSKNSFGFTPLFNNNTTFRPDMTIILEIDTEDTKIHGYGLVKKETDMSVVKIQQELNRYYSTHLFGTIKILPMSRGNVKKALKDVKELLLSVFR